MIMPERMRKHTTTSRLRLRLLAVLLLGAVCGAGLVVGIQQIQSPQDSRTSSPYVKVKLINDDVSNISISEKFGRALDCISLFVSGQYECSTYDGRISRLSQLDTVIRQRLYFFREALATTHDPSWSLGLWAKLRTAAGTLNGQSEFHPTELTNIWEEFEERSFSSLVAERYELTEPMQQQHIAEAIAGAQQLASTLDDISAETDAPELRRQLLEELYSGYHLEFWQLREPPIIKFVSQN